MRRPARRSCRATSTWNDPASPSRALDPPLRGGGEADRRERGRMGGRYRGQWVEWGEGIAGTHTDTELSQYQRCVRLGTSLSLRQIFSDESIEGHFLVRATSLTDCAPRRQIGHTRLVLQRSAPTPEAIVAIPANILNCNRVVGTARAQRGQR